MICVYDSGVGGLSTLAALRTLAPWADVLYLGDTARVPYGTRGTAAICRFAEAAIAYLGARAPRAVLCACGTVSTVYLPISRDFGFPVFGVADAAIDAAIGRAPSGRIAVLGTAATVRSGYFAAHILARRPDCIVRSVACPIFVALAECGMSDAEDPIPALAARRLLAPLTDFDPEALILGCTHFPWLAPHIARALPRAQLVDCGAAAVCSMLPLLAAEEGGGRVEYLVTDDPRGFAETAERMLGRPLDGEVTEIALPI